MRQYVSSGKEINNLGKDTIYSGEKQRGRDIPTSEYDLSKPQTHPLPEHASKLKISTRFFLQFPHGFLQIQNNIGKLTNRILLGGHLHT